MNGHSFRRLGRDALVYGLGQVMSRLVSVIMLPLYTRLLTPSDYGILQLLDMTLDVVSILVSAGTTAGVMRFYFKATSDEERHRLLASAWVLQVGLNLLGSALLMAAAPWVWSELLDGARDISLVYIAAINFTLSGTFAVPMLAMQLQGRSVLQASATLARLIIGLGLNILLLTVFELGPKGILLSSMTASLIIGLTTSTWMLRQTGLRISRVATKALRAFGLPYQLATAGTFILTFGDRFFLERAQGLAEVGLYGLSYNFGFLLAGVTYIPYMTAWNPLRHAISATAPSSRDAAYRQGLLFLSLLTVGGATAVGVFVRPALQVMSNPAFHPAAYAVPLILVAILLQAWTDVVKFNLEAAERTGLVARATWIAAAVIIVLYALLIPAFGAIGAALATALAFLLRFALFLRYANRVWPVAYDWRPSLRLLGAFAAATGAHTLLAPPDPIGGFLAGGVLLLCWGLVAVRELPAADRRRVLTSVRSPADLVALLRGAEVPGG